MRDLFGLPVVTGLVGTNASLLPEIFSLYVPKGSVVADVTYGRGVFWANIPESEYQVLKTDLVMGTNFQNLPYETSSVDVLILDPPYMHGGITVKPSINDCYRNTNGTHTSVIRLYAGGILEAARVLKKSGRIIVKTQDEIESGRQRLSHIEIVHLLEMFGFRIADLFVLLQKGIPAMREDHQKSARKNHSFAIVGIFGG